MSCASLPRQSGYVTRPAFRARPSDASNAWTASCALLPVPLDTAPAPPVPAIHLRKTSARKSAGNSQRTRGDILGLIDGLVGSGDRAKTIRGLPGAHQNCCTQFGTGAAGFHSELRITERESIRQYGGTDGEQFQHLHGRQHPWTSTWTEDTICMAASLCQDLNLASACR
jgi:hypothetical protein